LQEAVMQERTVAARTPCEWRFGLAHGARPWLQGRFNSPIPTSGGPAGLLTLAATVAPNQVSLVVTRLTRSRWSAGRGVHPMCRCFEPRINSNQGGIR
jgi:hypothetical protein